MWSKHIGFCWDFFYVLKVLKFQEKKGKSNFIVELVYFKFILKYFIKTVNFSIYFRN